jgi:hypothetical protein
MSTRKLFRQTKEYRDVSRGRKAIADFVSEVLVPFGVCTLGLLVLSWPQNSSRMGQIWPFVLVVSSAVGIVAFFAFVGRHRGMRLGIWRDLM